MNAEAKRLDRRSVLKLIPAGALSVGIGGLASPVAQAAAALDLASPEGRMRAFIQMRGGVDDRLTMGFVTGRYYGVVDDQLTPLYGVTAASFSRYRPSIGGGYELFSFEQAYFTDLASGAAMSEWANPYTGRTVKVPVTSSPPRRTLITPDLAFRSVVPTPGFTAEHVVLPVERINDDVRFVEQVRATYTLPNQPKPLHYSEVVTLQSNANDLVTKPGKRIPCETAFTSIVGWRPWLEMGDRPGHLMAQGVGRYGASIDTMPLPWVEATRASRPELLTDASRVLDPLWNA